MNWANEAKNEAESILNTVVPRCLILLSQDSLVVWKLDTVTVYYLNDKQKNMFFKYENSMLF